MQAQDIISRFQFSICLAYNCVWFFAGTYNINHFIFSTSLSPLSPCSLPSLCFFSSHFSHQLHSLVIIGPLSCSFAQQIQPTTPTKLLMRQSIHSWWFWRVNKNNFFTKEQRPYRESYINSRENGDVIAINIYFPLVHFCILRSRPLLPGSLLISPAGYPNVARLLQTHYLRTIYNLAQSYSTETILI